MSSRFSLRRRSLLGSVPAALMAGGLGGCAGERADEVTAVPGLNASGAFDLVDPFIGTGGHGHTYPGASVPFGFVQVSPDTDNTRWDSVSGYHMDDPTMLGFSHTHLSGTGVGDMLDVLLRPGVGEPVLNPGTLANPEGSYRARYAHQDEYAEPGYYRVLWREEGITTELTATCRTGLQRYHFPATGDAFVLVDFAHGMQDHVGVPTRIKNASLQWTGVRLTGSRQVYQWASGRMIAFAMEFSRPPRSVTLYSEDRPVGDGATHVTGERLKAVVRFDGTQPVTVRTGLSPVDEAGALANLTTELQTWAFDTVRHAARHEWTTLLARAEVEGGTIDERKSFYTGLYHAALGPTVVSDADGRYRGLDKAIHTAPQGRAVYSTYSIWDTYRAEHPLLTLLFPERVPDIVQSLVLMMEQTGRMPIWPLQDAETGCMTGRHAASIIVEAMNKGFEGFDRRAAWRVLRWSAFEEQQDGLDYYHQQGWIPADRVEESTTRTVEYSFDDWAFSQLAAHMGDTRAAERLKARSASYRHLYDPSTGFIRPRLSSGRWAEPFAPNEMGHMKRWRDYTESNPWQATFLAQHDVYGMTAMMGGESRFIEKIDGIFAADPALPADAPPDIAGQVGQYAHGNEPSQHIAYLYSFAGQPWKTQERVRMLQKTMYAASPDGLAGNEDVGQMSAWFVMSALGLYPVDPTTGIYVFGSPLFERVTLKLAQGRTLRVEAPGASTDARFIQSVTWNGQALSRMWISHQDIVAGGTLRFVMGTSPNVMLGAAPGDRPPSLGRISVAG